MCTPMGNVMNKRNGRDMLTEVAVTRQFFIQLIGGLRNEMSEGEDQAYYR